MTEKPPVRSLVEIVTDSITSSLRVPNPIETSFNKDLIKLGNIDNINYVYGSVKNLTISIQYLFKSYKPELSIDEKKITFNEYKYFLSSKFKELNLKEEFLLLIDGAWEGYKQMSEMGIDESALFEIFVSNPILKYIEVLSNNQMDNFEKAVMSEPVRCDLRDKTIFLSTLQEFCYIENSYIYSETFLKFINDETDGLITEMIEQGIIKVNDEPLP